MDGRITTALRLAMLAAALLPAMAAAADFSGAWVRDAAATKAAPYPNYWLTRSAPAGGNNNAAFVLTVQQNADSVRVTDPIHPQRTYRLDGKPQTMPTDSGMAKVTTTAKMTGEKLSVLTVQPYGGMPGNVLMRANESWDISPDGQILTITTVRESPATKQTYTEIYKRR